MLSPLINISTGDNHLIRCDTASKANTTPDVISDIFCIDISIVLIFVINTNLIILIIFSVLLIAKNSMKYRSYPNA